MNEYINNILKKGICPRHKALSLKQRHAVSIFNPGDRGLNAVQLPFIIPQCEMAQLLRAALMHGL